MLKSILLYLESNEQAVPVIELGVSFAKETDARVREGIQLSINAVATALRNSG